MGQFQGTDILRAVMRRLLLLLVIALAAAACTPDDTVETTIAPTADSAIITSPDAPPATTDSTTPTTPTTATTDSTTPTTPTSAASTIAPVTSHDAGTVQQSPQERARDLAYVEELSSPELGSGLPAISRSFDIEVADLNGDGHDDIIFATHQNRKVSADSWDGFWVWTPDGYELIFLLPTLVDRHGCTAGDVNGDGAMDVYCQLGAFKGSGILKSNELWIQTAPGTFENQAEAWGVDDPSGRGRWPVMFDYDKDGLIDLYVTNDGDRTDDLRSENILFRNLGDKFEEVVTGATGDLGGRCLNAVDFTGDGWTDLAMCDESGTMKFLENVEGTGFRDVSTTMYEGRRGWKDAAFDDLDQDGDIDMVLVGPQFVQVRLNKGAEKWFKKSSYKAPLRHRGWGVAIGDFYGDDNLDVYVLQQGKNCTDIAATPANGRDILFVGPEWERRPLWAHELGCGDEALTLDEKLVLVSNGADLSRGPLNIRDLRTEPPPVG